MPRRIFVIEDDVDLADIVRRYLENSEYEVSVFHRGDSGLKSLVEKPPDLAILDIMLPGMDGLEVLREVRTKSNLLVILVSAKRSEIDRVLGLELGGDDYLTKPFSVRELVARVKALFRRSERQRRVLSQTAPTHVVEVGGYVLDLDRNTLSYQGATTALTLSEFSLLSRLMRTPEKTFSRQDLSDCLAGERGHRSRAIDTHIGNLRKKIAAWGVQPLRSVRGVGYRFQP